MDEFSRPFYHPVVRPGNANFTGQVPHPVVPTVEKPVLSYNGSLDFNLLGVPLAHYSSVQKVRYLP